MEPILGTRNIPINTTQNPRARGPPPFVILNQPLALSEFILSLVEVVEWAGIQFYSENQPQFVAKQRKSEKEQGDEKVKVFDYRSRTSW
jgi:hypothetical protein